MISDSKQDQPYWLVEYVGAVPCPVYARISANGCGFTCDAWQALKFATKAGAEAWMIRSSRASFNAPWAAVEHVFQTSEK